MQEIIENNIEMVDFTIVIPNKTKSGILKEIQIKIPCYYDNECKEYLLTSNAVKIIDYTKAMYMLIENVISLEEYITILKVFAEKY